MADFNSQDWEDFTQWVDFEEYQHQHSPSLPHEDNLWCDVAGSTLSNVTNTSYDTPDTFDSFSTDTQKSSSEEVEEPQMIVQDPPMESPSRKRQRQQSEDTQSEGALIRSRKTRKLKAPLETAKIREKGACFLCQKKRKVVRQSPQSH